MKFSFAHMDTAAIAAWIRLSRKERILAAVALLAAALVVGLAGDMYYFFRYMGNERAPITDTHTDKAMLTDEDINKVIVLLKAREEEFERILAR